MAGCTKQTFILSTLVYLIAGSPITGRDGAALPPVISFNIAEGSDAHLEYPWAIARDGGGGGTVAGKYIINFSDTTTMNTDDFESFGFYPFVSNSIASAIAEYVSISLHKSHRGESIADLTRMTGRDASHRLRHWLRETAMGPLC